MHVMEYMKGTCGFGTTFEQGAGSRLEMKLYVDSDYASKAMQKRSMTGMVVMCAGSCVTCSSRTQKCVMPFSNGS